MMDKENTIGVSLPTFIRVLMPNGRVEEMKLETYLAGVVAMEIGGSAPLEALKAQAVAARTYAAAAHRHPEHDADVCVNAHCQKWKRVDPVIAPEVFRALSETWGMVAIFEGKLIDAFFFEHCDGHTRNSEEMLMPPVPYLRGVDCSCGFLTLKGHGVGMCKRGAIVMARRGASFEQILHHYYRGVVVIHAAHEEPPAPTAEPPLAESPAPPVPPAPSVQPPAPVAAALKPEAPPARVPQTPPPASAAPAPKPIPPAPKPAPAAPPVQPAPTPQVKEEAAPVPQPPPAVPTPTTNGREKKPVRKPAHPKAPSAAPAGKTAVPAAERAAPPPAREAKPAEPEKPAEVTVNVESTRRRAKPAPARPDAARLRDVLVGEVVKSEETAAPKAKPAKPPRRVHIDHLPGQRMIAGSLPESGLTVLIEDSHGHKTVTQSGTASHYGEGGFELMVEEDGRYLVTIDDQVVEVQVDGETVFIHAA